MKQGWPYWLLSAVAGALLMLPFVWLQHEHGFAKPAVQIEQAADGIRIRVEQAVKVVSLEVGSTAGRTEYRVAEGPMAPPASLVPPTPFLLVPTKLTKTTVAVPTAPIRRAFRPPLLLASIPRRPAASVTTLEEPPTVPYEEASVPWLFRINLPTLAPPGEKTAMLSRLPPQQTLLRTAPVPIRKVLPDLFNPANTDQVEVQIQVDRRGWVTEERIVTKAKLTPELRRSILNAAEHWKFRPALEGGMPVDAKMSLIFRKK